MLKLRKKQISYPGFADVAPIKKKNMPMNNRDNYSMYSHRLTLLFVLFAFFIPPGLSFAQPVDSDKASLAEICENLHREHPAKSGAFVLENGIDALLTRAWLADHAAKSIDVQYFIWSTDNIGILAAEGLLRAAERGAKVRVIVDDFLMDAPDESILALAAHPGIDIRMYNPTNSVGVSAPERMYGLISNFRSFNQRMHDKTFIVDGQVAVTGGRNMADEYFDYDHEYNFRDRDILLLGPVVAEMEKSFDRFWQSDLSVPVERLLQGQGEGLTDARIAEIYAELHAYAANPDNFTPEVRQAIADVGRVIPLYAKELVWEDVVFVSDVPGKNESAGFHGGGKSTAMLVEALKKAEKSITIQSPYLIFPDDGIEFFARLVAKGVEVKISTNSLASTDNLQAFSGYSKQRGKIERAGIKVYEYRPDPAIEQDLRDHFTKLHSIPTFAIHAKTMVIDGELLFVGTFNLDPRSVHLNTEVGVLIRNIQLAGQVERNIATDMLPENSWDISTSDPDAHAPWWKQLKMSLWAILPIDSLL